MTDKEQPDTAVETYTITISSAGRFGNAVGFGAELDCCFDEDARDTTPVGEVGKDIVSMDRNLAMLVDAPEVYGMFVLPILLCSTLMVHVRGPRTLGVELFYTDDSPGKYRVHGFKTADSDLDSKILLFPVDKRWARVSKLYGLVNCGFHTSVSIEALIVRNVLLDTDSP